MKCKRKGHLAFNCPPKYNCEVRKPPMNKNKHFNKRNPNTQKEKSAAFVKKFAGMVISTIIWDNPSHDKSYQHKTRNKEK